MKTKRPAVFVFVFVFVVFVFVTHYNHIFNAGCSTIQITCHTIQSMLRHDAVHCTHALTNRRPPPRLVVAAQAAILLELGIGGAEDVAALEARGAFSAAWRSWM